MADYIVFKDPLENEPKLQIYSQFSEEHLLLLGLVPGENFVVVSEIIDEKQAEQQADSYFRNEHAQPRQIHCWAAGARARQACLGLE